MLMLSPIPSVKLLDNNSMQKDFDLVDSTVHKDLIKMDDNRSSVPCEVDDQ